MQIYFFLQNKKLTVACFFLLLCFDCISRSSFLTLLDSCSADVGWPGGDEGDDVPVI